MHVYYSRIMLTRNKKQYAGTVKLKEGNILNPPMSDVKGLAIRKVSVTKYIRDYFSNILNQDILNCKEIKYSNIISKYRKLEDIIKQSLLDGKTDFIKPDKVNDIENYVNPMSIMSVRATLAWNALYPEKEIPLPNKINVIKLKFDASMTVEDYEKLDIPEDIKSSIINNIITQDIGAKGFTVLALPKTEHKIPDWVIPYLDVKTIVMDCMKPGLIMLESLKFDVLDIRGEQFYTNIIEF